MDARQQYYHSITTIIDQIMATEWAKIAAAANVLADAVAADKLIHIAAPGGHSTIAAMEVFYRAGGLAQINPMFPPGMNIITANPITHRLTGLAPYVLNFYEVKPGDPIIVTNFYGINPAAVDIALTAKERNLTLITVNSHSFADEIPREFEVRHPSSRNLNEIADIALDNHVPIPDAVVQISGVEEKLAATATIATCFLLNLLMVSTAGELARRGIKPDIWVSNNIPGGDDHNNALLSRYLHRVHHLYPVR